MTIFRSSTTDPVRANTVIFGVVDFSASIFQIPSIFFSATVESIMQQVDMMNMTPESFLTTIGQFYYRSTERMYEAFLVSIESVLTGTYKLIDAIIDNPVCSRGGTLAQCPQLSIVVVLELVETAQSLIAPVWNWIWMMARFLLSLFNLLFAFSDAAMDNFW